MGKKESGSVLELLHVFVGERGHALFE